MHDHKHDLSLYLPQIRPQRTHALLGISVLMYCTPVVFIWWLRLYVIKINILAVYKVRFSLILIYSTWVFQSYCHLFLHHLKIFPHMYLLYIVHLTHTAVNVKNIILYIYFCFDLHCLIETYLSF